MGKAGAGRTKIPRDPENDYTPGAAEARRAFLRAQTGVGLEHASGFSFDPSVLPGNIEHFAGVTQVPIGIAGPMLVNGEYAQGEFYVPLATTEGTLVASYNRGMKTLREAGGVTTTSLDDAMQRAPAFVFRSAREARSFGVWLAEHFAEVRQAAEATTPGWAAARHRAVLRQPDPVHPLRPHHRRCRGAEPHRQGDRRGVRVDHRQLRGHRGPLPGVQFRHRQEELASQRLAHARQACRRRGDDSRRPDRGADAHERRQAVPGPAGFEPRRLHVRVNNNGLHSANGIAALFIATGQDMANVAESSAALNFSEPLPNGDYYASITLPSLIVATYGGGTGLATQRECLELLGCYGAGKVRRLAEIVAATVLCGELSLGWAILTEEWVSAHDRLGRNRP